MKIHVEFEKKEVDAFSRLARKISNEQETPVMENVELIRKPFSMSMWTTANNSSAAVMEAEVKSDFIEDICFLAEDLWSSVYAFYKGFKGLLDAKLPGLKKKWARTAKERDLEAAKEFADSCLKDDLANANGDDSYTKEGYGYLICKEYSNLNADNVDEYGHIHTRGYTFVCHRWYGTKSMKAYNKRMLHDDLKKAVSDDTSWFFYGDTNNTVVVGASFIWKFLDEVPVEGEETLGWKPQGLTPEQEEMSEYLRNKHDAEMWDEIHRTDAEIDAMIESNPDLCE